MVEAKLLLWDIDGTLLSCGSAPREAIRVAIQSVIDQPFVDNGMRLDGRTDPFIFRSLLSANGVPDLELDAFIKKALRTFGRELAVRRTRIADEGRLHPGVAALLQKLKDADVLSTVLTGNLAVGAVLKLSTFGLDHAVDVEVGGFGSDREDRDELVQVALKRIARKYRSSFDANEVWIIGDTPHDLQAARSNGVRCALVATGRYSYEELSSLEPDATFLDLSDTDDVLRALGLFELAQANSVSELGDK